MSKSINIFCGRLSEKLVRLSQKWLNVFVGVRRGGEENI